MKSIKSVSLFVSVMVIDLACGGPAKQPNFLTDNADSRSEDSDALSQESPQQLETGDATTTTTVSEVSDASLPDAAVQETSTDVQEVNDPLDTTQGDDAVAADTTASDTFSFVDSSLDSSPIDSGPPYAAFLAADLYGCKTSVGDAQCIADMVVFANTFYAADASAFDELANLARVMLTGSLDDYVRGTRRTLEGSLFSSLPTGQGFSDSQHQLAYCTLATDMMSDNIVKSGTIPPLSLGHNCPPPG